MRSSRILRSTSDFLQTHLQEPELLFLVHEWHGFARDPSQHIKTPTWISTRRSSTKGGTRNRLLIVFLSPTWVPQASLQTDSALTYRQEQKPQELRRTRWPQEKGLCAINPDSHASYPLHSYGFGYDNRSKYDVPWDWLCKACHMARVHWEARCEGFVARKVRTIGWNEVLRTSWNAIRCKERLRSHPAAVFWQAAINLFKSLEILLQFQSQAVLRWFCGGLCHTRKCQFEDFDDKRHDLRLPYGRLHSCENTRKRKKQWILEKLVRKQCLLPLIQL